jgi:mRNA interferase RelE/StbE
VPDQSELPFWHVVWSHVARGQAQEHLDDVDGLRALFADVDRLADDPHPSASFPYGHPDDRRLRSGRYRVYYRVNEAEHRISIDRIARLP